MKGPLPPEGVMRPETPIKRNAPEHAESDHATTRRLYRKALLGGMGWVIPIPPLGRLERLAVALGPADASWLAGTAVHVYADPGNRNNEDDGGVRITITSTTAPSPRGQFASRTP